LFPNKVNKWIHTFSNMGSQETKSGKAKAMNKAATGGATAMAPVFYS
jgi:hypothetical protein